MIELTITSPLKEKGDQIFLNTYTFPNGRHFPKSYKTFVEKYGYGLSLNLFIIYIPLGDYGDSWEIRTEEIKNTYFDDLEAGEDIWFDLEPDGSINLLKRWIPFAASENGHYLFWDPDSGKSEDEMDIYITDFKGIGIRKAGSNIDEVFQRLTDSEEYKLLLPFSTSPLPKTFKPLSRI